MTTSASLLERHPGVIDLSIRNRPGVQSYQLGAAVSLDVAFAGTTPLVTVGQGRTFRSLTLQRNKVNLVGESLRGLTRIAYDPVDFASPAVPGDAALCFLRVAEIDLAGVTLPEGPILVVPAPGFFGSGRSSLFLNGTAPNLVGEPNNMPTADGLIIDLPRFVDEITIFNDDGANSLFIALSLSTQELEVPFGTSLTVPEAGATEILLRGAGATPFRLLCTLVNGIQG
jgi:hypothetical protein